ncbi:MAG TPA: hypothetical protein VN256_16475 [Pyrinomonadaceae bacterium]|nr:hypothetical protein [Pyrinomonadaceae bacterium]
MKRTETIIETHEVWVVRRRAGAPAVWCAECAGRPAMLTPEEAARLSGLSQRAICRSVEAGAVHFLETADGCLFVCTASLCDAAGRGRDFGLRTADSTPKELSP